MTSYLDFTEAQLQEELATLLLHYNAFKSQGLKLNMARGKPAPEQLDLSRKMLELLPADVRPVDSASEDVRNYGNLLGIPQARELMGQILGVPASEVLIGGNSSLNLMYDSLARAMLFGVLGETPFSKLETVKWLCPAPGYDRHFAITQNFNIENIAISMNEDGPDMQAVQQLVEGDAAVKGIWCVPMYSNPQGFCYSEQVVRAFARLKPAAKDFRIYWDNAYAVHSFSDSAESFLSLRDACIEEGNPHLYYMFVSTSKITFAGGGISALATSQDNLAHIAKLMSFQTIGHDKVNQLRHVKFLEDHEGVKAHMRKHAALIVPKFNVVLDALSRELEELGIARWTKPVGGYFISFDGLPGTAARTVALAKHAGVELTDAGATYPYGSDPEDKNIRLAPTFPSLEELAAASELFCVCVKIAAVERLLATA